MLDVISALGFSELVEDSTAKFPELIDGSFGSVVEDARIARVLRVLELIQSRGRWNMKAIVQELEYSERTIYRDLQLLELAGIPWFFDEHEQCYRVRPDCRFPFGSVVP